jgi:hypothetical protein
MNAMNLNLMSNLLGLMKLEEDNADSAELSKIIDATELLKISDATELLKISDATELLKISDATTASNDGLEIIVQELSKISKDNRLKDNWITTVKDLREVTTDSWIKCNLKIGSEKDFLVVQSLRDSVHYAFNPHGNEQIESGGSKVDMDIDVKPDAPGTTWINDQVKNLTNSVGVKESAKLLRDQEEMTEKDLLNNNCSQAHLESCPIKGGPAERIIFALANVISQIEVINDKTTARLFTRNYWQGLSKDVSTYNSVLKNWATIVKDLRETPGSWIKWNVMSKPVDEPRFKIIFDKGYLVIQSLRDSVCYVVDLSDMPKCGSFNAYGNEQMETPTEKMDKIMADIASEMSNRLIKEVKFEPWKDQLVKDALYDVESLKYRIANKKEKWSNYPLPESVKDLLEDKLGLGMEIEEKSAEKKRPSSYQLEERQNKLTKRVILPVQCTPKSVLAMDLSFPGLVPSPGNVPLYFRASSFDLFEQLNLPKPIIMIQGPPGSGKSSMTWVWASQLDSVCWIHLDELVATVCSRDGPEWVRYTESHEGVLDIVASWHSKFLILDGIVKEKHAELVSRAIAKWLIEGKKLVLVCSLQYVIKAETLQVHKVAPFEMPSWTFQEYQEAYANEDFKKSISEDIFPDGDNDEEKLEDKYFVAGGSARWMFQFTVSDAIDDIERQISRVGTDAQLLLKGLEGERSNTSISHLFCSLDKKPFIISEFATRALAEKCESSFLTNARNSALALNPSFDGWILEAEFIYRLRAAEVKIYRRGSDVASHLPVAATLKFTNFSDIKAMPAPNTWLIPMRWNQACFDSVQVLPEDGFRFVQVTRSKTHSLKKKYIVLFLDQFVKTLKAPVKFFEFWFVVPNQSEYNDFSPKIPEGSYGVHCSLLRKNDDESEYSVVGFDRL